MESARTMHRKTKIDPEQQTLDFTSRLNERFAQIRSLELALLDELGPRKVAGIVELLERLALCSTDLETSNARLSVLAAGIRGRRPVAERTIRRWRTDAEALGLLEVDERSHRFGGALTNRWTIRLDRLRAIITTRVRADMGRTRGGHDVRPGADMTSDLTVSDYGNGLGMKPVPDGPDTDFEEVTSGGSWNADRESGAPRPENVAGAELGRRIAQPAPTRGDLLTQHPILAAAVGRQIAPLACRLIDGKAFLHLTQEHLRLGFPLVIWFREQLGLERPLLEGTEAHLLLVIAAAQFALTCPEKEVSKTRVSLFAYTVGRRLWLRVLHKLPAAREQLDELLRWLPEAYTHADRLGPKREQPLAAEVAQP